MHKEHKVELPPHLDLNVPLVPSKAPDAVKPVEEEKKDA
jgi:hypothetical protein